MAKKQILSNLFVDVIKDGNRLKKTLATVKDELSEIAKIEKSKLVEIDEKTLQGLKSLEDSLKKLTKLKEASQETVKTEKKLLDEEEKVRRKLKDTTEEELKVILRQSKILQEQKQRLKAIIDLERAEIGSINELRAKVRLLTQERDKAGNTTDEEIKKQKELNAEIDKYNELIDQGLDKKGKQRSNIGNYREDIEKAIGELTQGNAVLGVFVQGWDRFNSALESSKDIFANLQAEFKLVRAGLMANTGAIEANTVATTVNTESTQANSVATAVNTSWLRRHFTAVNLNTKAIWRMVTSTKALKIALASTGIGLLIVALTGLVGMFSQGISGSLRFEKVVKGLGAGLNTTFSGLTQVIGGVILKMSTWGESFSLTIDQIMFKLDSLTLSSEEKYKKLQELNKRQEELDVTQANANLKIQDGLKNLGKIAENSAKAVEGAYLSLQRRLQSLNLTVTISKLSNEFKILSELAEDDTISFKTRMSAYSQSYVKQSELLKVQMKQQILEYQGGLGDIIKRFREWGKGITSEQQHIYDMAVKLQNINPMGMDQTQLSETAGQYENLTKKITKYLATVSENDLVNNMDVLDENEVNRLVDINKEVIQLQTEQAELVIQQNERQRKAIQDRYEIEFDLRENFVLRLKDLYVQQASDENRTYKNRLDALDDFRYASEIALKQGIESFNEYSKEMEKLQKNEFQTISKIMGKDLATSVKGVTTELVKMSNEYKLLVNGIELNKDVFQKDFLDTLSGENSEKSINFLKYLNDLITDVNTANYELAKSNYDLQKSYVALNLEIQANERLLKQKQEAIDEEIALNNELLENKKLVYMTDRDLMLFKEKQDKVRLENELERAEIEQQNSLNNLGNKRKELEALKELLVLQNELKKDALRSQILATEDTEMRKQLEKQLNDLEAFRVEETESYKKGQNELLALQEKYTDSLQETSNKQIAIAEQQRDVEKRILKERADMLQDIASGIDKFEQMMFDRKMKRLDREYERSKNHEARLIEAKKMGSEQANESLALEIAKQEKILLKKEKLEKRKQRTELVTAGLKAYATNLEKGVTNPLSKTFTDTVALAQFLKEIPLFWEGAENVGDKLGKPHLNDKRDNYLVRVDGGERVMTNDQNAKLGNISNDELAEIGNKWNSGLLMDMTKLNFTPSKAILQPNLLVQNQMNEALLKDIKDELKSLPSKMPISSFEYDEVNKMTIDILKKGNNVYKTRSRIR